MNVRIGIDIGGSFIKAGILNSTHRVLWRYKTPSGAQRGAERVKENLRRTFDELLRFCEAQRYTPVFAGIGSPGIVGQPLGQVKGASPNIKGWPGTFLCALLGRVSFPTAADNDANCAAVAEYLIGLKRRYSNMVLVTIGTGIGGALILDGRLYRGRAFAAGELGHTLLRYGGRRCRCGQSGCLEAYASVPRLMSRARALLKKAGRSAVEAESPQVLFRMYRRRDPVARQAIEENARYIGAALASVVSLLDPEVIVVGGGLSGAGKHYLELVQRFVFANTLPVVGRRLKVIAARLGNDAGFIGASCLGMLDKQGNIYDH